MHSTAKSLLIVSPGLLLLPFTTLGQAPPVTDGLKVRLDAGAITGVACGAAVTTWNDSATGVPEVLSDNGITQQIKVTVPAGSGVTRRFLHIKITRP